MAKKNEIKNINKIKEELYKLYKDIIIIDEKTYKGASRKAKFIDKEYGEWWATPTKVLRGQTNKKRGRIKFKISKTTTINEIKERIKLIHNDNIIIDEQTYINLTTKARFFDKKYGEWWTIPYNVLQGHRNPKIRKDNSGLRKLSIDEIKERIKKIHGNEIQIKENTYIGTNKKATFIDKDYGEFCTCVNNVLVGKGCKERGFKKLAKSSNTHTILFHWETRSRIILSSIL